MDKFKKVLVAEDDNDDYQFFAEALQRISHLYEITRVKTGLDCITFLKKQPRQDLIFLDLNIPAKNGLECLKFIREHQVLHTIPVIIYSTSHYIRHIDEAYKNDANYYIVKPSNGGLLYEILTIVINRLNDSLQKPTKGDFVVRNIAIEENQQQK